jgi:hypothetical protein
MRGGTYGLYIVRVFLFGFLFSLDPSLVGCMVRLQDLSACSDCSFGCSVGVGIMILRRPS